MGLLKLLVPKRFRKTELFIPVVRLHRAIMAAGNKFPPPLNHAYSGKGLRRQGCPGRRHFAQFARWLAGAGADDL